MTTTIDRADERVRREREAIEAKQTAYRRFRVRLESVSTRSSSSGAGETLVATSGGTRARPIREAFAETVATVCEERPTGELLAAELGEEVATHLTTNGVTPALRRAVRTESERRGAELAAMDGALGAEADSLERAANVVDSVREWLIEVDERPLPELGFEELRERHARLAGFRDDCEGLVADRQAHLGRTTGAEGQAGVRHDDLRAYLYEELPVDHPVPVTATRLDGLCTEAQRTVRDHLVRRV
ncbi:DUF7260 family protein [Halalkalicoccus tibetensis]|uniref:DUF7260 domain-containing protein n=1 Tax=Halalkalicoccus tibetensis TaxID=175632 RepID=A0ABD5V372_9EURY